MKLKFLMIFNFFERRFFIDLRAPSVPRKTTGRRARGHGERRREPLGRVFGRQSTRGHHTNVLWKFGEKFYFLMIFDFFELGFFVGSGRRSQPPSRSRKIFSSKHDRHWGASIDA